MAPIELPCPSSTCDFKTVKLEYAHAEKQLELHTRLDHAAAMAAGGGDSQRKPEKFPRPEISIDKSTEDWHEFKVTWDQYKEEYGLSGKALI